MMYNYNSVIIIHKPTGIMATCMSERSQHRNKAKALNLLRARLWAANNLQQPQEVIRCYYL